VYNGWGGDVAAIKIVVGPVWSCPTSAMVEVLAKLFFVGERTRKLFLCSVLESIWYNLLVRQLYEFCGCFWSYV